MKKRFAVYDGPKSFPAEYVVNDSMPLDKISFEAESDLIDPANCPRFTSHRAHPLKPPIDVGERRQPIQVWCSYVETAWRGTARICGLSAMDCPFQSIQGTVSAPNNSAIPVTIEAFNPGDSKAAKSYANDEFI